MFRYSSSPTTAPEIRLSETGHDFNTVPVGSSQDWDLRVYNDGSSNLVIGSITSPASPFSKVSDNCSGKSISPGQNCAVTYRFYPVAAGNYSSTSTVPSNDPDEGLVSVTLIGEGVQPSSLSVTPFLPKNSNFPVSRNNVAIRHYSVQENGQVLKGQFATISINGMERTTPWQKSSEDDVGGVDLSKYASSDTLWVAIDTKAFNLSPGQYEGRIVKIGSRTVTPVTFTINVLDDSPPECYFGNTLGAEVSFGKQIGAELKNVVNLKAGVAAYVSGENSLFVRRMPNSNEVYLRRESVNEGGGKAEAASGLDKRLFGGKFNLLDAESGTGMKISYVESSRYDMAEGLSSKAAFTVVALEHLLGISKSIPITLYTSKALQKLFQKDFTYELEFKGEVFHSTKVELAPSIKFKSPQEGKEGKLSLNLLSAGTEMFYEVGTGWNYEDNEDWISFRLQAGLESAGVLSLDLPALGVGLYRYSRNGIFDRYELETWTSENTSTFWK